MTDLFVYGTLMNPENVKRITGCIFVSEKALIKGYKRFCVKGFDYPAINKEKDWDSVHY